jgi:alcohol-forming fatty acyl-CoA reductase
MDSVKGFYKDKNVFVTGASGFMGKVLLEKILYSCSDVNQIFVLMREKKGKSGLQRVEEFSKIPLFDRINNGKPEVLNKIVPIYGDIGLKDLGMSNDDFTQVINETNIVFHMAASVNFEEPIKNALNHNVRAVKYTIDVAKKMPNLISMVHLSTAFCNTEQKVLDEITYDWDMDPIKLLDCAETMNDEILESAKKALLKTHPNVYTYTKRLAELLVRDAHKHLPIAIVRPSIGKKIFIFRVKWMQLNLR